MVATVSKVLRKAKGRRQTEVEKEKQRIPSAIGKKGCIRFQAKHI